MKFAMWGLGFLFFVSMMKLILKVVKQEDKMMVERKKVLFGKQ